MAYGRRRKSARRRSRSRRSTRLRPQKIGNRM